MSSLIKKIFLAGLLILIIISPVRLKGNEVTAKIDKINDFIICSKLIDNAVVLTIDIGPVLKSDSLYACNFEIEYIPELIRLGGLLTYSTLAEGLSEDYKAAQGDSTTRTIRGFFYSNYILYGNKPLFALRVELIDTCYKGVIPFKLKYLEFTDEFQKKITTYTSVDVIVLQNDTSYIKVEIPFDSLFFEIDDIISLPISVSESNYRNVKSGMIEISNMNLDNYEILSLDYDNKIIEAANINTNDSGLEIEFTKSKVISTPTNFFLRLRLKNKLKDFSDKIEANIKLFDDCNCSSKSYFDSVVFNYKFKDTISGKVDENIDGKINFFNGKLEIMSENEVKSIELINIIGENIEKISVNNRNYYIDLNERLSNGTYFLIINTDLNKIRKKIFINN